MVDHEILVHRQKLYHFDNLMKQIETNLSTLIISNHNDNPINVATNRSLKNVDNYSKPMSVSSNFKWSQLWNKGNVLIFILPNYTYG